MVTNAPLPDHSGSTGPSSGITQPQHKPEIISTKEGKKFEVIHQQEKVGVGKQILNFMACALTIAVFPITLAAYALSTNARESINNLFKEFRSGTREVKVVKEYQLPPPSRSANDVASGQLLLPKPPSPQKTTASIEEPKPQVADSAGTVEQVILSTVAFGAPVSAVASVETVQSPAGEVTRENLAEHMQQVVTNYYGQPFPHRDEVMVEHEGKQVHWISLTPKEKFDVVYEHSLPHNRPKLMTRDKFHSDEQWVHHIEGRLFRGSHNEDGTAYIPGGMENDPRLSHGSDHGIRVGIFSAVYAALYNKYDPTVNLTPEDLLAIQLAGAFHDSGRQTEGVDVDDKRSAENAAQNFKKWGFSETYVKDGEGSISGKDDQKLSVKSVMAKCVQCADSTEYGRVGFFNPKYLDISKEFNGYKANPKENWHENISPKTLKEGRTLEEFNADINAVNEEMASIMQATASNGMRKAFSQPGKNYYAEILKVINPTDHPRIHAMFTDLGVIGSKTPTINAVTSQQIHKAQQGTATPTVVSPTLEKTGELFPGMLSEVKFVGALGGSTGAQKVVDKQGVEYARKTTGSKIKPEHLRAEYHTNKAYKALGVKVPDVALYHASSSKRIKEGEEGTVDQPVMLSKFVPEGTIDLDKYFEQLGLNTHNYSQSPTSGATNGIIVSQEWKQQNAEALKDVQNAAKKSFVADCLLANWDVAGLTFDNMRYDPETKEIWRIDNGAGLDFRAQGGKKPSQFFTADIKEFQTLRDPNMNPNTTLLFATLTDEDIISQIDGILPHREAFLATIPDHLKEIMGKRFDYLNEYKQTLLKE